MNLQIEANGSLVRTRPNYVNWIAILILLTGMRFFMFTQLSSLEMFGGVNPDAWFAPWISDTILGALVPLVVFLVLRRRGIVVWGMLLVYNAIGAFDYAHGLLTQWTDPLVPNGMLGTPGLTYGSIGFSLFVQLIVLFLLFQRDVVSYYTQTDAQGDLS